MGRALDPLPAILWLADVYYKLSASRLRVAIQGLLETIGDGPHHRSGPRGLVSNVTARTALLGEAVPYGSLLKAIEAPTQLTIGFWRKLDR